MRMQFPKELTHEPQHPVRNGPGNFRASPKQVQDILAACSAHGSIADVRCKALRGLPQATWLPNKEPWDLMWGVIYWRDCRVWFQTLMSPHCCRYFFSLSTCLTSHATPDPKLSIAWCRARTSTAYTRTFKK